MTLIKKAVFKKYVEYPLEYGLYVKADSVSIFNLHLDDISSVKRRKQISDLRPFLEKEPYVVIGGDFNQEYKKGAKIYDIPNFTVHNDCNTYFVEKNMNIDNILTKGFASSIERCLYLPQSVEEGLRIYGSDHIPVTTTVY
jgi:endonuclease/exonuclease/phosphatase family metal-dependent hydrolase